MEFFAWLQLIVLVLHVLLAAGGVTVQREDVAADVPAGEASLVRDGKGSGMVIFEAHTIGGFIGSTDDDVTFIFGDVKINIGGGYDPLSSFFTAPVAGFYYFTYSVLPQGTNYIMTQFMVVGQPVGQAVSIYPNLATRSDTVYLNVGDSAYIECLPSADPRFVTIDRYNSFGGFLLYQSM